MLTVILRDPLDRGCLFYVKLETYSSAWHGAMAVLQKYFDENHALFRESPFELELFYHTEEASYNRMGITLHSEELKVTRSVIGDPSYDQEETHPYFYDESVSESVSEEDFPDEFTARICMKEAGTNRMEESLRRDFGNDG